MNEIENQILETWYINHRTNLKVIEAMTDESLQMTTSKRGGGSIAHQLAHMYNVRYWKLENFDKAIVNDFQTIKAIDEKTRESLINHHEISTGWITEILKAGIQNDGQVKGFKRGVVPMLGYFIHHEAHHRGNIMLTLKLCGFKAGNDLKYGIWEWNKI